MGDFTWHTSDPDHTVVSIGGWQVRPTVYLLTPDGQRYAEGNYKGYGEFGGMTVQKFIEEWNEGLRWSAASLYPYGDVSFPAPKFPLKLTHNPDATYDELPASIPAADTSMVVWLTDYELHDKEGNVVVSGMDGHEKFWSEMAHSGWSETLSEENPSEGIGYAAWVNECFLSKNEETFTREVREYVEAQGLTLVYVGWSSGLSRQVSQMMGLSRLGTPPRVRDMTDDELVRSSSLFQEGFAEGSELFVLEFFHQKERYRRGHALTTEPMDTYLEEDWDSKTCRFSFTNEGIRTLGRAEGAREASYGYSDLPFHGSNPYEEELARRR